MSTIVRAAPDPAQRIRTGALTVDVHRHIEEVEAEEWDAVVGPDELQATHAFIRACQDADVEHVEYRHLVVRRAATAVGVASVFRMPANLELLCSGPLRAVIRGLRRIDARVLRPQLLLCGLPVSAGRPCLAWRRGADARDVVAAVAAAMEQLAREQDVSLLCFKEFDAAEADVLDTLRGFGYFRAHSLPSFRLELPWPDMAAYAADMRAGYRRQLLRPHAARERSGLRFRTVTDYGPECPRIFALYEQVIERAEFRLERLNQEFFERLAAGLAGRTRAILAERDGRLLAAAVILESPALTTFFMAGIDYARNRSDSVYLNLVEAVVADAIRSGTGALELGQTSAQLKTRFGAVPTPRFIYFRHRSGFRHALFRALAGRLFPETAVPERRVFRGLPATSSSAPQAAAAPARSPS